MKTNIKNMFRESRSYSDVSLDRRLTVVRPSFDRRSALLKMVAVLVMVLTLGVGQMWGDTWNKVTSAPSDWSGEYLLVYESSSTEGVAWTGVDANYCNTGVTISSSVISTKPNDAVSLIIASITDGYSIQISGGTNDGKYIGGASGSNTISFSNSAILNTLSYESSSVKITSNTSVLRYNYASNNLRFRYFKSASYSSQQIVQLYKKTASGHTVTINKNNNNGTVSAASVTGVANNTSISASGNVLSVGTTDVTATPNSGYKVTWTGIPAGGKVTENITVTANFAAVSYRNYRTSCATDDPSVSVTESLTDLGYILGNSPVAQSFSFTGSNLESGTITVTAPTNFEVCKTANGTYTSSITFTGVSGTLASTIVYVRLASGKNAGEYSGNVSISGCGLASAVNVAVVGTVVAPTITVEPTSVSWNTQIGVAAETRSVTVTGTNLKANISAALTGGDAGSFSISTTSITQTSGSASGTITITYTGSTAATTTKTTTLRLTSTDATTVDVPISFSVIADPRDQYQLLTSSNLAQVTDGAKLVLVYESALSTNYAAKAGYVSSNGYDRVEEGATEFEISGSTLYAEENNHLLVLTVGEMTGGFSLHDGSKYLANTTSNKIANSDSEVAWTIGVSNDGDALITCTAGQMQTIKVNASVSSAYFRAYAADAQTPIYAYFQPSTAPSITVSPTSLAGLGYVVGDGANSEIKSFNVTGMNLSGNLTVKAPTNYQVSTDNGSNWSAAGGTASITASGTLNETTVKVRLVSGKPKGTYNDATGVKVYGGGVLEANAKTVSLAGAVTNPFHTVTISAGSHGSVSPSGARSVEQGETLTVTPTADAGYEFSSWTVTGTGSTCVGTTFTMGTENATLTANFSEILVTSISITGTTTVKPTHTTQLTATCTPNTALNKDITWSTSNSGIATVSNTGLVTGVAAGSCTITATNTNSGVSESVTITVQETILYKYYELTSSNTSGWTGSDWDGEYLIVNTSNACYFNANTSAGNAAGTVYTSCTITNNKVTLEDDNQHAVRITYVANSGYTITPVGTGGATQYLYANGTGNTSWAWYTSAKYFRAVDYNNLDYSSSYCKFRWNSGFKFYGSTTGVTATNTLYKRELDYTVTCNTPINGTLSSSSGTAAAGITITLTVTPNSNYELDALTITKAGGGTVTPTKVTETSYTFTMPADNVTVTATFKAAVSHTLHFNVPSCVTAPSDITEKTGATVTLPSEPAGTPDGYTFQGWVLAEATTPVAVKPTTYNGGSSYTVPSGSENINMYALYSEGGISVGSGTFNYIHEASSGLTTLVQLTSDYNYILSSDGNKDAVVSNTISGTRVGYGSCTGAGESTATISTADGVYLLHKTGDYYTLKNVQTGQYLASTGVKTQATMMDDDGTDDHVKWSIVSTQKGYKLANKYNTDNSVNAYLAYSSGNGYGCYASSNGGATIYFYQAASGAVTINTTYTTSPDCFCDYTLLKSTDSGSNWEEVGCFTKVKPNDDTDHEWQLANFTMPAHNSSTLLKVQRQGYDYGGQTQSWQSGWIPLAELQGGSCSYKSFEMAGAVGTLRIYDVEGGNSVESNSNFYLGFLPTYQICHKNAAPDVWIDEAFEYVETSDGKVIYQTAITAAPASYFDDNYQFYVGVRKSDGSTKFVDKQCNDCQVKSNTVNMKTMGGMTSDVGGRSGVYQIYANYCDQNWYCQFVPYYVVYYYDVNGNEIEEWRDVMTSTSTTAHPYATGQTSWNTAADGSGTTYAAGATISGLSDDLRLYQIASTYTVTYSVASETSSYNGTSVKVIQGQAITLPTITFSCAQYPTFVGWVSGADILETNPLTQIEEPSTLVGAGGDSYTPTGNVTLKALYGSSISNDGWKKATSISAGTYFMYAQSSTSNYVCSGWNSSGGDKTAVDDVPTNNKFADKPSAASTITIDNNHRMSWDGYYAVGADKDLNYTTTEAEGTIWDITNDGYIHCTISSTDYYIQIPKSGTIYFKTYSSSQDKAYLYKYSVKGYYTTNPTCALPTQLTVTYMKNVGDLAGVSESDVENWCSNEMLDFSTTPGYPTLEEAFEPCATPTLDGYTLQSWNTSSTGLGGTEYKIDGTTYGSYNGSSLTLYAQWDRTYTVHFIDRGDGSSSPTDTEETQASLGASVPVPSNPTPCNTKPGVTWTFVGWGTQDGLAQSLNGHIEITAGTSTYTPSDDITLYAVYRKSTGTSDAFAIGTSGAYTIGAKQDPSYPECLATTKFGTGYYCSNDGSVPATIFYLNYVNSGEHNGQYTLQDGNTGEYVGYAGSSTSLSFSSTTPYYYNVVANGTGWNIQCSTATTRYFTHETGASASNFKAYQDNNPVTLHPAAASTYYTVASCDDDFNITFVENGSEITWQVNHGEGTYYHLADGTEVSVFPTASFDGWTFLGWRTADYVESTTAPEASTIYGGSDGTSGNHYEIHSSITMYPIFTRFEDNEPFDQINGGDYYIYFLESGSNDGYGGERRVYAGSYSDHKRYESSPLCSGATEFTFTKLANGNWTIKDKTTGNYLYGIDGDDDLKQRASATNSEWTLTVNGNQFDAFHVGTTYGQLIAKGDGTSATFMNYRRTNISQTPSLYHRVYLGGCSNRTFTTNPSTMPTIEVHGQVKVTSTATKSVKARNVLTVTANNISTANLTVTSDNSAFKFSLTSNGSYTASVNIPVVSNKVGVTPVYIEYTPAAGSTSDGVEGAIVTVSDGAGTPTSVSTVAGDVQGRHLPENFVIAAKWGDNWYALPANCKTTGTWQGMLIEVDNASDPTTATLAPDSTKFGLREVASGRYAANGSNVTFTERIFTATANDQLTLYNGATTNIRVWAQWSGYHSTNPEKYEWVLSTDDFKDYTLTSADGSNTRPLCMNTSGMFGTFNSAKSYDGKVRLLPATFYEEAAVQVLEWKANSVVVMYTGTETSATTRVGANTASSPQTLADQKLTHAIYELTTSQALTSNDGKMLLLGFGDTKKAFDIPVIINSAVTATTGHDKQDVVIVSGGKLTAAATKYSYRNVYVYGGGKLKIASGTSLGVNNIILRAGGITTSGIGSSPSATYNYVYPQVELGGTLTSTVADIKYEYITDYDHWYHLCLPFNATLNSITYPQEYYGHNVKSNNTGSWIIKRYAGEVRATGNVNAWVDIESESATEVIAGHGYIYWGAPKKISVGNAAAQRPAWGIQRITMSTTAAAATTAETANKTVSDLSSYSDVEGKSTYLNDLGWNLIGNPFMTNLTGLTSDDIVTGKLEKEIVNGKWTGKWINNGDGTRYVTIPSDHFNTYEAKTTATASNAGDFMPGRAFFVQIDGAATGVTFNTANRDPLTTMPALLKATATDVETGIVMSNSTLKDEVNFWIKDGKTAEYEYNADYPKTPNQTNFNIYGVHSHGDLSWVAISPEIAATSMAIGYQVPAAGTYTLTMSETYVSDEVESLFVTDHAVEPEKTVDLLAAPYMYEFNVNQAETNNTRFTISIVLKEEAPGDPDSPGTGLDKTAGADDKPVKFIWHDKMYILNHGIIYDATGKKVREIK